MFACRRLLGPASCAALAALLLWLPAGAWAADPVFTSGPAIQGDAVVGSTLQVVATWTADPPATATYAWGRCPTDSGTCTVIPGATQRTYVVTADDIGFRLSAQVTLSNGGKQEIKSTPPTDVVVAAPAPAPPPPPAPVPAPSPPITAAASSAAPARLPAFLRPFPVVRIRGYFARRGARITLLSVRGPRSAKVTARCVGRGCPVRTLTLPVADGRLHRFERFLRAGILLQIRVTRPGRIGRYTSFLIRSRKPPLRTDRCLSAKGARPIQCSAP